LDRELHLLHLGGDLGGLDGSEQLAPADLIAFLDKDFFDHPARLEREFGFILSREVARDMDDIVSSFLLDGNEFNRNGLVRLFECILGGLATACGEDDG